MKNHTTIFNLLFVFLLTQVTLDIVNFFFPSLSIFNLTIWGLSSLIIVSWSIHSIVWLVRQNLKSEYLFTTLLLGFHIYLALTNTTNLITLSGETTQEISCMLANLNEKSGYGLFKTCLFQYPSRQFYLAALPTLLLGPSLFALNLGGALWFLIGIPIFAAGLARYFKDKNYADLLCATCLALLYHFQFFNHFLFHYEQSIYPLSMCMAGIGIYLHYLSSQQQTRPLLPLLAILAVHASYAYTPALSLVAAIIAVLIWAVYCSKANRLALVISILAIIIEISLSLSIREDIRITGTEKQTYEVLTEVYEGLKNIPLKIHGDGIASNYVNYFLIIAFFAALFGFFKVPGVLIAIWILTSIIAALAMRGYLYYGIDFRLHRASVIYPAIILLGALLISRLLKSAVISKAILFIILCYVTVTGQIILSKQLMQRAPSGPMQLINYAYNKKNDLKGLRIITAPDLQYAVNSVGHFLKYFAPEATGEGEFEDCSILKKRLSQNAKILYVKQTEKDTGNCQENLTHANGPDKLNINGMELEIYSWN